MLARVIDSLALAPSLSVAACWEYGRAYVWVDRVIVVEAAFFMVFYLQRAVRKEAHFREGDRRLVQDRLIRFM